MREKQKTKIVIIKTQFGKERFLLIIFFVAHKKIIKKA